MDYMVDYFTNYEINSISAKFIEHNRSLNDNGEEGKESLAEKLQKKKKMTYVDMISDFSNGI